MVVPRRHRTGAHEGIDAEATCMQSNVSVKEVLEGRVAEGPETGLQVAVEAA